MAQARDERAGPDSARDIPLASGNRVMVVDDNAVKPPDPEDIQSILAKLHR